MFTSFLDELGILVTLSLLCYLQSDREKSEGLPVAPFMDRDKVSKPTAQIGFIKFVLIPLFELLNKVLIAVRTAFLELNSRTEFSLRASQSVYR